MARKKTKKIGIAGKYGVRYGRKIRENVRKIETLAKKKHKCPQCGKEALKRTSTGIWECSKCKTKMAGGAYVPQTGLGKISKRAVQGASKEEIITAFQEEETVEEPKKPKAKPKPKKLKKPKPETEPSEPEPSEPEENKEAD